LHFINLVAFPQKKLIWLLMIFQRLLGQK